VNASDEGGPELRRFDLVIFDCDGVLVDSELITNAVFATMLGELGAVVTLEYMFEHFMGHSMAHCLTLVRQLLGRDPPDDFVTEYRRRSSRALEEVVAVPGIEQVLDAIDIPSCVASNGPHDKMRLTLGITGLLPRFESRLFSADDVGRPKPAPDLFVFAASSMSAAPERTAVVEDSPAGIEAALAAGMTAYGYAGRMPARRLIEAGATIIFDDMCRLAALL
jgi:HAD superfamily hydrolase (TIGR01509 family)